MSYYTTSNALQRQEYIFYTYDAMYLIYSFECSNYIHSPHTSIRQLRDIKTYENDFQCGEQNMLACLTVLVTVSN